MVNLIGATTTETGLKVKAKLDGRNYETGRKILTSDMKSLRLEKASFRGDWNYKIMPKKS